MSKRKRDHVDGAVNIYSEISLQSKNRSVLEAAFAE